MDLLNSGLRGSGPWALSTAMVKLILMIDATHRLGQNIIF
ncbi:predicted protein [Botrytis cinerea T4]|uniref:Uncharacterized protein n=1 Tax=Botryotinia fuckeliana (strain T4) TaxID=999810 RepID=G2XR07_BOTF4|nr:predicted protein [Botrytis cinerea T4]